MTTNGYLHDRLQPKDYRPLYAEIVEFSGPTKYRIIRDWYDERIQTRLYVLETPFKTVIRLGVPENSILIKGERQALKAALNSYIKELQRFDDDGQH